MYVQKLLAGFLVSLKQFSCLQALSVAEKLRFYAFAQCVLRQKSVKVKELFLVYLFLFQTFLYLQLLWFVFIYFICNSLLLIPYIDSDLCFGACFFVIYL